jgi:hypothetical protein
MLWGASRRVTWQSSCRGLGFGRPNGLLQRHDRRPYPVYHVVERVPRVRAAHTNVRHLLKLDAIQVGAALKVRPHQAEYVQWPTNP